MFLFRKIVFIQTFKAKSAIKKDLDFEGNVAFLVEFFLLQFLRKYQYLAKGRQSEYQISNITCQHKTGAPKKFCRNK